MTNEIQKTNNQQVVDSQIMERIVLNGDLSALTPIQRVTYYNAFCAQLGLNPLTKPFQIIKFRGGDILYATKDCTEQLRKIHGVSICALDKLFQNDLYIVTATAQDKNGRQDAATGAVSIAGLKGDNLANAIMKSETKAKRRVTLSICGLGMLDDAETDTIGDYKKVDITTGEIIEAKESQKDKKKSETKKEGLCALIEHCNTVGELESLYNSNKNDITQATIELFKIKKNQILSAKNNEDIPL